MVGVNQVFICTGIVEGICLLDTFSATYSDIEKYIYVFLFIGKDLHGVDFEAVDSRIQSLEKRVFVDQGCFPLELIELRERVDLFKAKLEVFFVLEASIMMVKSAFVKICNIL